MILLLLFTCSFIIKHSWQLEYTCTWQKSIFREVSLSIKWLVSKGHEPDKTNNVEESTERIVVS